MVESRTRPEKIHVRLLPLGPDRVRRHSARADFPCTDIIRMETNCKGLKLLCFRRRATRKNRCGLIRYFFTKPHCFRKSLMIDKRIPDHDNRLARTAMKMSPKHL